VRRLYRQHWWQMHFEESYCGLYNVRMRMIIDVRLFMVEGYKFCD
jgi:hypothetical protein